jgi:TPR repeat protein
VKGLGGLEKNDAEAARLFKLAADQGYSYAQFYLGIFYENGFGGLPKNLAEAARLYKLAADQGDDNARANLSRLNDGKAN